MTREPHTTSDDPAGGHDVSGTVPRMVRARRIGIRVFYTLLSLWILMMASGLVALITGAVPDGPYAFAAGATTAWKLLSCGGFIVLAWTAGRSVPAAQWVVVGQATWLLADLVAPQDPGEGPAATAAKYLVNTVIFLSAWLLLAPERREILHLRARPDVPALAVVALMMPLAAVWAWRNAALTVPDIGDLDAREITFDLVGLGLVFIPVGVLAALRPRGVRWLLATVAGALAFVGVLTLLTATSDLASPGLVGGLACLAFAAAIAWRFRASIHASPDGDGQSPTRGRRMTSGRSRQPSSRCSRPSAHACPNPLYGSDSVRGEAQEDRAETLDF